MDKQIAKALRDLLLNQSLLLDVMHAKSDPDHGMFFLPEGQRQALLSGSVRARRMMDTLSTPSPQAASGAAEDIVRIDVGSFNQGHASGLEQAAKWHEREAERIRLLALESDSPHRMHEAQDDHLSHAAFIRSLAAGPTHRHKKRGTEYVLIGIGKMQADSWFVKHRYGMNAEGHGTDILGPSVDMREVAVYRSVEDGSLWVRPREEFEDGRFEVIGK